MARRPRRGRRNISGQLNTGVFGARQGNPEQEQSTGSVVFPSIGRRVSARATQPAQPDADPDTVPGVYPSPKAFTSSTGDFRTPSELSPHGEGEPEATRPKAIGELALPSVVWAPRQGEDAYTALADLYRLSAFEGLGLAPQEVRLGAYIAAHVATEQDLSPADQQWLADRGATFPGQSQ